MTKFDYAYKDACTIGKLERDLTELKAPTLSGITLFSLAVEHEIVSFTAFRNTTIQILTDRLAEIKLSQIS